MRRAPPSGPAPARQAPPHGSRVGTEHAEGVSSVRTCNGSPPSTTAKVRDGAYVPVYPEGRRCSPRECGRELFAIANKCAHMACPLEGGELEGAFHHLPVPRLALRRARRAFLDVPEADRHLCRPRSMTARSTSAEEGSTMADDVLVYALSTCPWCRKTKQWFTDSQIRSSPSTSTLFPGTSRTRPPRRRTGSAAGRRSPWS